jgi:uncharacterized membrane protein
MNIQRTQKLSFSSSVYLFISLCLIGQNLIFSFVDGVGCRLSGCNWLLKSEYAAILGVPVGLIGAAIAIVFIIIEQLISSKLSRVYLSILTISVAFFAVSLQVLVRLQLQVSCAFCALMALAFSLAAITKVACFGGKNGYETDLPMHPRKHKLKLQRALLVIVPLVLSVGTLGFFFSDSFESHKHGSEFQASEVLKYVEEIKIKEPKFVAILDPNCSVCQGLFRDILASGNTVTKSTTTLLFLSPHDPVTANFCNELVRTQNPNTLLTFARNVANLSPIGYERYLDIARQTKLTWTNDYQKSKLDHKKALKSLGLTSSPTVFQLDAISKYFKEISLSHYRNLL